jgi:hypothetical protein
MKTIMEFQRCEGTLSSNEYTLKVHFDLIVPVDEELLDDFFGGAISTSISVSAKTYAENEETLNTTLSS